MVSEGPRDGLPSTESCPCWGTEWAAALGSQKHLELQAAAGGLDSATLGIAGQLSGLQEWRVEMRK